MGFRLFFWRPQLWIVQRKCILDVRIKILRLLLISLHFVSKIQIYYIWIISKVLI